MLSCGHSSSSCIQGRQHMWAAMQRCGGRSRTANSRNRKKIGHEFLRLVPDRKPSGHTEGGSPEDRDEQANARMVWPPQRNYR